MNKTLLAGALAALSLTAASGALAQQSTERPHTRGLRADTDGDQRLSQAEFVGRRVARLTAADADRDGAVTGAEMRAAAEARRARRAERMAERGPIVIAEARARAETAFVRLDADRDGYITVAEHRMARSDRRERRREGRAERRAARPAPQASPPAPASE